MRPTTFRLLWLVGSALLTAFVCLAAQNNDSPVQGVGLMKNEPGAYQGYTLISPLQSKTTFLIDMNGKVVKRWESAATPSSLAYLLDSGNLLKADVAPDAPFGNFAGIGGHFQELDWNGNAVWDFTYGNATLAQHHDFTRLPNGNLLLLMKEKKTVAEAIAAGRMPSSLPAGVTVEPDSLVEIKPTGKTTGEVVWEWKIWEHLIQDFDKSQANFGDVSAHPELMDINYNITAGQRGNPDWTHGNAVAYNAKLNQIAISSRNFGEFWIIDHSTTTKEASGHVGGKSGKGGDFLYRWGNPKTYRAPGEARLWGQHNVHWIADGLPGAGHLLVFNNGDTRPGERYSSADEIVLPVDANGRYAHTPGQAFGPEKAVWSFSAGKTTDFYSVNISGADRLPNGNTLICSGAQGIIFEVTPQNKIVWQYNMPPIAAAGRGARAGAAPAAGPAAGARAGRGAGNAQVFRAYRFAPDSPALKGKSLVAGISLEDAVK